MREMKEYRYTTDTCVKLTCDICGKVKKNPSYPTCWSKDFYKVDDVHIERICGMQLPESHELTYEHFDCCPDCFDKHIRPLFKTGPHVVKVES